MYGTNRTLCNGKKLKFTPKKRINRPNSQITQEYHKDISNK